MLDSDNPDAVDQDPTRESEGDAVAPVIPDEHIKGDWRRTLVLPNRDGRLRLTSVKSGRSNRSQETGQIGSHEDHQRHSA